MIIPRKRNVDYSAHCKYCDVLPIARQRLGKHIPVGPNARNNRTSNGRQRIRNQASLIIEAVFSAWSMQSGCKEVSSSIE
jgi:hypothetical protein